MKKKEKRLLNGSIAAFAVSAASILVFPVDLLWKVPGILFWLGLIGGCAMQWSLSRKRRLFYRRNRELRREQVKCPGMFRFFSNKKAAAADIAFLPAVIGFIVTARVTHALGYLGYVFLAAALFAFYMHGVLNGRNYVFVHREKHTSTKNSGREEENTDEA